MPTRQRHIPELDGLRGIAILLVLAVHFWPATGPLGFIYPLASVGWIGVDLFFVISGFLITGILIDTKQSSGYFTTFLARRALRIFPLYYLFLAVAFTVIPLFGSEEFLQESGSPLWYLLYLTNLREPITGIEPPHVLRPLWSLAIEEHFYLVFPVVVYCSSRRQLEVVCKVTVASCLLFRVGCLVVAPEDHHLQYLLTPARIDTIAFGGLVAIFSRQAEGFAPARWYRVCSLAAFVAIAVATGFDRKDPVLRTVGYSVIANQLAIVVGRVSEESAHRWPGLRWSVLLYVGRISYGIYIWHRFSVSVLHSLLTRAGLALPEGSPWLLILRVLTAVFVATVSWYCFERLFLRLKCRFSYGTRADAVNSLVEVDHRVRS